jgi:hypothetical protein
MPRNSIHRAGNLEAETSGGTPTGLFADEEDFDRRSLLRLASWGAVAVGAVALALYTSQFSTGLSHQQVASADLARQRQQIQSLARESQNEARRLAAAIDTLNGDRDRLYSRVTVLEQGLDSVTGAIARQKAAIAAAPSPAAAPPPPAPAAVATTTPAPPDAAAATAAPPVAAAAEPPAAKSDADANPARPDPAPATASADEGTRDHPAPRAATPLPAIVPKPVPTPPETAAQPTPPEPAAKATAATVPIPVAAPTPTPKSDTAQSDAGPPNPPKMEVQKTEFAVDVGGANSLNGLRALWRGLLKSRSNAPLASLHPIIIIRESSTGGGMQLRLGAGPLSDAAAAARICALMVENRHPCETTVYDGQRLPITAESAAASSSPALAARSGAAKPAPHRRSPPKRVTVEELPPPPPPPPEPTTLSTIFGRR